MSPSRFPDRRSALGVSIGVSLFPDDAEDASTLVSRADTAMYEAKKAGGSRLAYASSRP